MPKRKRRVWYDIINVLHVEKDKEGKYGIRKADLQNLDHLLIESVGEEQEKENS